jgi:dodecin
MPAPARAAGQSGPPRCSAPASHQWRKHEHIVKIVEVIAQSEKSLDAAQRAVREAAKSVRGIKSVWIDNFSGVVEGDRIVEFRVNAKLSFLVEGHK